MGKMAGIPYATKFVGRSASAKIGPAFSDLRLTGTIKFALPLIRATREPMQSEPYAVDVRDEQYSPRYHASGANPIGVQLVFHVANASALMQMESLM